MPMLIGMILLSGAGLVMLNPDLIANTKANIADLTASKKLAKDPSVGDPLTGPTKADLEKIMQNDNAPAHVIGKTKCKELPKDGIWSCSFSIRYNSRPKDRLHSRIKRVSYSYKKNQWEPL